MENTRSPVPLSLLAHSTSDAIAELHGLVGRALSPHDAPAAQELLRTADGLLNAHRQVALELGAVLSPPVPRHLFRFSLLELIHEAWELNVAGEVGGQLKIDETLDGLHVTCDRKLVVGLLRSILDNACRYGPGPVAASAASGRLRIEGRCIPIGDDETVDALAAPFQRGAAAKAAAPGRLGIGLSAAISIAAAHGWELAFQCTNPEPGRVWRGQVDLRFPA